MTFASKIQSFLKKKLKESNLTRKDFAQKSGISYTTVNKLINTIQANPEFKTILNIAKFCNCTTDKVVGRKFKIKSDTEKSNLLKDTNKLKKNDFVESKEYKFNDISLDEINNNLRNFINTKLKQDNLSSYKLGKNMGYSELVIFNFIKGDNINKTLSSEVILALADYFQIPLIDEMIGRISSSNQESQALEKVEPKTE